MALPVNITDLIHGKTVEWERLEFKQGWNPEDVLHSVCAFANDLHNWGGGYIIIGVAEENGRPVLPPKGLEAEQIDAIQKKVLDLAHKIQPNYFPIMQPYVLQEKHILTLWCPAGDHRMYTAPTSLSREGMREPYVRIGSSSMVARGETLRQLLELTARIPFDDRINQQATVQDMDLGLIQAYLQEVKSDLYRESLSMTFEDLCRTMLIAKGTDEFLRPINVGLLFFSQQPERFFSRCQIEVVWHRDDSGRNFTEHYFKGPLHKQLRDALSFIRSNIIAEQVVKHSDRAEADRFYNFPYEAVEEALANAVYHKSYELGSPIEVQIWTDKMEILSYPGPIPPVNASILKTMRRIVSREYRNRRIGDFLKELHLTEGRGTGFPTIYKAMNNNGSPAPVFDTDADSTFFLTVLPAHEFMLELNAIEKKSDVLMKEGTELVAETNTIVIPLLEQVGIVLGLSLDQVGIKSAPSWHQVGTKLAPSWFPIKNLLEFPVEPHSIMEIMVVMKWSDRSKFRQKYITPLLRIDILQMSNPEKRNDPNQRYFLSEKGKTLLKYLKK